MSGRYSLYPDYKDSGLDWLGRIPMSWELRRLGSYFRERRTKASDTEYSALSVTMQGIVPQLETAAKTKDGDNRKLVVAGDFVINSRSDRKGSSGVSPTDGSVSLISIVLEPVGIHPPFAHHLLRSSAFQEEFYRFGKGIVADLWSTNYAAMKNIIIPVMCQQEQTDIAKFLDYETAKIDALLEKQQQLIALLKEKRQAVISHAVTKGLNPKATMRDSGIEWLGTVPAHWTVGQCGFYLSMLTGFAFPSSGFSEDENDVRLLRGVNVAVSKIRWEETVRWKRVTGDGLGPYELAVGDLVLGMDRPVISEGVRVAKIGPNDVPCLLLQRVARLTTGTHLSSEYLMRLLSSDLFEAHFSPETTGVSVPHISPAQIADFVIPIPPTAEQKAIIAHIDSSTRGLDALALRTAEAEEHLEERRAALITAAVTGKIDVRGWEAPESKAASEVA